MAITGIDHIALTVRDPERTAAFYRQTLGMEVARDGRGRIWLHSGRARINLHPVGAEFKPHALYPLPGSADLCLLSDQDAPTMLEKLWKAGVAVELATVIRKGARGEMESIYFRDPDGNLVEIGCPLPQQPTTPD